MKVLLIFVFVLVISLLVFSPIVGSTTTLLVENVTIDYVDEKYIHITTGVHDINGIVVVNATWKFKTEIPENFMIYVKAFKWFIDDYRIEIFQIRKPFKDALEMESFDLQTAFLHRCRPPLVWPIQKDVTYHLDDWIPDVAKFPASIPGGKWKVRLTGGLPNKNPIMILYWFATVNN